MISTEIQKHGSEFPQSRAQVVPALRSRSACVLVCRPKAVFLQARRTVPCLSSCHAVRPVLVPYPVYLFRFPLSVFFSSGEMPVARVAFGVRSFHPRFRQFASVCFRFSSFRTSAHSCVARLPDPHWSFVLSALLSPFFPSLRAVVFALAFFSLDALHFAAARCKDFTDPFLVVRFFVCPLCLCFFSVCSWATISTAEEEVHQDFPRSDPVSPAQPCSPSVACLVFRPSLT
ncbi:hypothetical protein, conserved in T. vivax [Trypanosoma vivax Y486]|uniref:Transmembrane protein n=1 Tax=Trypanosoma vivax (strain Y486) TaxID=1055687 RepID=F9WPQ4_TRYVY|nr:hypothetical protein, conserved in T. vivax [Trypanosoma vivax Y486]|eukprot:CCD19531.1 hypothetical protein, conserved in T. vivax [Trypanosoma vivax Y486]